MPTWTVTEPQRLAAIFGHIALLCRPVDHEFDDDDMTEVLT